jgi:hypothetical protein
MPSHPKLVYMLLFLQPYVKLRVEYVTIALIVLAIVAVLISSALPAPTERSNASAPASTSTTAPAPTECITDLDCGVSGTTDYFCWNGFIAKDHVTYVCLDRGWYNATCQGTLQREVIDWCRSDEYCLGGKSVCQPNITSCHDGVRNQEETGVDCGGPCPPCVSCNNGKLDGDETAVDCGGSCPDCTIQCTSNMSCGLSHWEPTYCGEDHSVWQDYITYECRNKGRYNSFCKKSVETRRSDYCGPFNRCERGQCSNMTVGGQFRMPGYICEEGEECATDRQVYTTCRGAWCFKVKVPADGT